MPSEEYWIYLGLDVVRRAQHVGVVHFLEEMVRTPSQPNRCEPMNAAV
jgi:hypothetical protein